MKKKTCFYKPFCYLGCFLMLSSLMLFSYDAVYVYASEIENAGGAVADATKDDVNFDMEEDTEALFSAENIESGENHTVKYMDGYRYEIDLSVTEPEITTYGTERTKYGKGEFKCYNTSGVWLFTATLTATFHYNGKTAWTTYGYYSWEYNTSVGFGQSIQKNKFYSEKSTTKTKYVVKTAVYTAHGSIGVHTFKLTCTPQGNLNSTQSVC